MVASYIATEVRWLVEVKFLWKLSIFCITSYLATMLLVDCSLFKVVGGTCSY